MQHGESNVSLTFLRAKPAYATESPARPYFIDISITFYMYREG